MLHLGASYVVGIKDIPICYKQWNDLGNDLADWRGRCFVGDHENISECCQAEKKYFRERRLRHRKLCFYKGTGYNVFRKIIQVLEWTDCVMDKILTKILLPQQ